MRSLLFLLLSLALTHSDKDDSLWDELKEKAPQAFQFLKSKVSDAVEDWRDKKEDYSKKDNTDEMLCEIEKDDDKVHKIMKKLSKADEKFKKLVKKIKKFFKGRKDALDCSKKDFSSEGDECLCEDDSNEAFCFLESVKDSYERVKGKLDCSSSIGLSLTSILLLTLSHIILH